MSFKVPTSLPSQVMQLPAYDPNDIYIAVMGVTGAGKSTFVSKCCHNAEVGIGHGLKSHTQTVQVFSFSHNGQRVNLIDTPGFDDTYRTDSDVLKDLAYWLTKSYQNISIRLSGLVYLHRITDVRMSGNAFKNLRTFQKLCGKRSMSSVVLATTMWADVRPEVGAHREADLGTTAEFWGDMVQQGSTIFRHTDDYKSAMNIILHLINKRTKTVLEIQTEMVDLQRSLDKTEAGQEVAGELIKVRQVFEQRLQQAQEDMNDALAQNDTKQVHQIAQEQEKFRGRIAASTKVSEELRIDLENLIKEKEELHRQLKEEFDHQLQQEQTAIQKIQKREAELYNQEDQKRIEDERIERQSRLKRQWQMHAHDAAFQDAVLMWNSRVYEQQQLLQNQQHQNKTALDGAGMGALTSVALIGGCLVM